MVLAPILIDLTVLMTFLVALALALLARQLVRALFQVGASAVGWIPWLGSKVAGDLHVIEQRITNRLGEAAVGLQHRVGATFHSLAHVVEQVGETLAQTAEMVYALAALAATLADWHSVLKLYHSLVGQDHATVEKLKGNSKGTHKAMRTSHAALLAALAALVKAQAIPSDVVIPRDLTVPRARTRAIEDELAHLWRRVRALEKPIVAGIALGALAHALARLKLGWLRCSNVGKLGRRICGMNPSFLEALLADSLLFVGSLSIVTLAEELLAVEDEVVGFVKRGFRELKDVNVPSTAEALASGEWQT